MKANLTLDQNNYILTMKTAIDGEYEVPDDINLDFINCYQLVDGEFVFDETKYEEIKHQDDVNDEIEDLEKKLNETDYIIARWGEELVALDNPLTWITDVIRINNKYRQMYLKALLDRKIWRARIEELRGE